LIDLVKTMVVTFIIGKVINPDLVTWRVMSIGRLPDLKFKLYIVQIKVKIENIICCLIRLVLK
jgi:hypothetical protein